MKKLEPISEKKAAANRLNAQKSTGPKSEGGKIRSRHNAVRHGLRSESIDVLPTENPDAFEARKTTWNRELRPSGTFETYLVDLVTANSWRLDRCRRVESSRLSSLVRDARDAYDRDRAERTRKLIEDLPKSPSNVVPQLSETSEGIIWMLRRFGRLFAVLESRGYLEPTEKDLLLNLFGKTRSEIFDDLIAFDISQAYLNAGWSQEKTPSEIAILLNFDQGPPNGMQNAEVGRRLERFITARDALARETNDPEFSVAVRARKEFVAIISREMQLLRDRLPELQAKESAARDEAEIQAACDFTPQGQAISRYEAMQRRAFYSAVRDFIKHRESVVHEPGSGPPSDEPEGWETSAEFGVEQTMESELEGIAPNEPNEVREVADSNPTSLAPNEPNEVCEVADSNPTSLAPNEPNKVREVADSNPTSLAPNEPNEVCEVADSNPTSLAPNEPNKVREVADSNPTSLAPNEPNEAREVAESTSKDVAPNEPNKARAVSNSISARLAPNEPNSPTVPAGAVIEVAITKNRSQAAASPLDTAGWLTDQDSIDDVYDDDNPFNPLLSKRDLLFLIKDKLRKS